MRIEKVAAALEPRLASNGFKKMPRAIFTSSLADGFIGWLGLNYARRTGGIEINPVVGVRSQELERMLSTVLHERVHKYIPPTISISLGYLMPEQRPHMWDFGDEFHPAPLLDLSEAIIDYGVPFMKSSANLRKIDSFLESKFAYIDHAMYRRPLVRWLLGDAKSAVEICQGYRCELGQRSDAAAEHFRRFAGEFDVMAKRVDAQRDH